MKSSSQRKLSSFRPQSPPAEPPPEARPATPVVSGHRLAARFREFAHRMAALDEALGMDEAADGSLRLDALLTNLAETAEACEGLAEAAGGSALDERVKRLGWTLQALEACREPDGTFMERLGDVEARLGEVVRELGLGE
jgi:hypothetical protein